MRFLWLDINASYSHSSLAFPALEAQIQHKCQKDEWKIVSGTTKSPESQILLQILDFSPNYIFATGWLFNIEYLLSLLSKIQAIQSGIKIVLGGPEFLGDNTRFLQAHPFITAVFKGEGEEIFPLFIQEINKYPDSLQWRNLPGFEYAGTTGNLPTVITKPAVYVKDFASLVPAEQSCFFNWKKAFVQLETSRGCFNRCKFCVSGMEALPVQTIPVARIRERLHFIKSQGIKEIRILDRTFNASPKRAVELLDLFEEFQGQLKFHLEIHPALLTEAVKAKLADVPENLLHIEAGIQSLDDRVLQACSRAGSNQQALAGLNYLLSLKKFEVHTDFIAGLPEYTQERLLEDIRYMMGIAPDEIQLELLKLLPGTCLRENAAEYGLKYSPVPPYEVLETPCTSFRELTDCLVLSKIIEYWYNDPAWRPIFRKIVMEEPVFLQKFTESLARTDFLSIPYSFESKSLILYTFCKEHHPCFLFDISLGWIRNGLSIKKEPAKALRHWICKDTHTVNPVFDKLQVQNNYYYMDGEQIRYWFVYNKQKDRNKPVAFFEEKKQVIVSLY